MASTPSEIHRSMALLAKLKKIDLLLTIIDGRHKEASLSVTLSAGGLSDSMMFAPGDDYHSDLAECMNSCLQKIWERTREELKELGVDADAKEED